MARRRYRARRQFLDLRRREDRLAASREAEVVKAKLQAHLSDEEWAEVEARWEARPDLYLPQQRRDFLVGEANRLGLLHVVPLSALTC